MTHLEQICFMPTNNRDGSETDIMNGSHATFLVTGAAEYTNCISAGRMEGGKTPPPNECPG